MIILIGPYICEVVDFCMGSKRGRSRTMHIIGLTVEGKRRECLPPKDEYIEIPSVAQLEELKEWYEKNQTEKDGCDQCSERYPVSM